MKKTLYKTVLLLAISFCCKAQTSPQKQIADITNAMTKALLHPTKPVLDKLISADVSYGHSNGMVQSKPEIIENLLHGPFTFITIAIPSQTIKVLDKIAMVRQLMNVDYIEKGVKGKYKFGILLVWRQENNQWKLLARQAIKL